MREIDKDNPYRRALAANHSRQKRSDSGAAVILIVMGLIGIALLAFAFAGDTGVIVPADLAQTATGGLAD